MVSTYYHGCQFHALTATKNKFTHGCRSGWSEPSPKIWPGSKASATMFGQFMRHLPSCRATDHVEGEGRYLRWARGGIRQQGFRDRHGCMPHSKVIRAGEN